MSVRGWIGDGVRIIIFPCFCGFGEGKGFQSQSCGRKIKFCKGKVTKLGPYTLLDVVTAKGKGQEKQGVGKNQGLDHGRRGQSHLWTNRSFSRGVERTRKLIT